MEHWIIREWKPRYKVIKRFLTACSQTKLSDCNFFKIDSLKKIIKLKIHFYALGRWDKLKNEIYIKCKKFILVKYQQR